MYSYERERSRGGLLNEINKVSNRYMNVCHDDLLY